jgi:hypothetical protein
MNAKELQRWLRGRRGGRKSQLPMHGGKKELHKGLVRRIIKDLGLED